MEYGIQRRTVYLTPPLDDDDRTYILQAFDQEEVWSMFGHSGPARAHMERIEAEGRWVRGVIRRVADDRRIGFSLLFHPPDWLGLEQRFGAWEYGIVVPERADRDGFQAICASDAMTHYVVDHLGLWDWWWRIKEDNRPSRAIARRMGYRSLGAWSTGANRYVWYRMPKAAWLERRARLDRAERTHPSPGGASFLTLEGPPYRPITGAV